MYIQYANDKTICNSLAKYKVGEIVITLSDINCDGGIIEKNTKLQITQIRTSPKITIPKILENKLNEYVSEYDEYTFIYKLKPVASADVNSIELSSSEFESADNFTKDFAVQYRNKKKNKRVAAAKMWAKATLIMLTLIAIVTVLIGLSFIQLFGMSKENITAPSFCAGFLLALFLVNLLVIAPYKTSSMFEKAIYYHCIRKGR